MAGQKATLLAATIILTVVRPEDVRAELRRLGIRTSRALGQHFLIDERVAHRHVESASIQQDETVLEIGPGLGVLTRILAKRSRKVIAIEKDRRLADALGAIGNNVEVIAADALEVDWPSFGAMVANLPYAISSPITFRLLDHRFDRAALMFQQEFSERMVAKPGGKAYSRLTVGVHYRAECTLIERVPRSAFYPIPKVDSAIVRLVPRPPPYDVHDEAVFHRIVSACFRHRRKTIANALALSWREFASNPSDVRKVVHDLSFQDRRAESLSPNDFADLANAFVRAKG